MKRNLFFLILGGLLFVSSSVFSQVGVNTETPYKFTELHVKNIVNGTDTIPKGIMIPRLTEAQRNQMVIDNTTDANSLMIYNIDEDCYNYYSKTEKDWQSLCGKMGKARFEVDCSSIRVFGIYGDGVALNTSNYLKVTVNVTKVGSYNISATANPDNGYFYDLSGTFYSTGPITLTLPGTGQPVNHTQGENLLDTADDTPDEFTLTANSDSEDCNFIVNVHSTAARPHFEMECGASIVEGMYFEDQALSNIPNPINNQSHRIKVTLKNIPATSYGAVAVLTTNIVDGISFIGEAVLSSSTQEIYLHGTGIPRGLSDKVMTITSNSETSNESCNATVYMLIPSKRLMTLGNTTGPAYSYNAGLVDTRSPKNNLNTLLTDKNNFGYNQWSILKFSGFVNKGTALLDNFITNPDTWVDDDRDIVALQTSTWQDMSAATLESFLKGTNGHRKIDIFMIGFDTNYFRDGAGAGPAADRARCQVLTDFVKTGGILMICSESTDANGNFMNMFFNDPSPAIGSDTGAGPGSNYTLGFNSFNTPAAMRPYYCKDDDPILRGPFEDILGRNWGEDASVTRYLTNLPLDEIIIYSGARPMDYTGTAYPGDGVTIFRHRDHSLVFIGDGGFNSSENRTYRDIVSSVCPFQLTNKTINGKVYENYPDFRFNFLSSGNRVYNTAFTANAFAWCIMKAEEYRRNNK